MSTVVSQGDAQAKAAPSPRQSAAPVITLLLLSPIVTNLLFGSIPVSNAFAVLPSAGAWAPSSSVS
jgi:hypothetical protein